MQKSRQDTAKAHSGMKIRFSKMHGLGNDFVVINAIHQQITLSTEQIRHIADRHFGIGCDQLLIVESPTQANIDFRYRIFNADGSEVEQCGNGARCFVRFIHEQGLSEKTEIKVETKSGIISPRLETDGNVSVDMGAPRFLPHEIPFISPLGDHSLALLHPLEVAKQSIEISLVSMGNPHAVYLVPDCDTAPVAELGPLIETHPSFPRRVNAGFMQLIDRQTIHLRVYERGAGETLACGTGACAAVVSGIRRGLLDSPVQVHTRGGNLKIAWAGEQSHVIMTGPALTVFNGEIELS